MYTFISDVLHVQPLAIDTFVLYSVVVALLGLALFYFWKVLALGAFSLFCLSTVFSHNAAIGADASQATTQAISYKKEFMQDCLTIAMNTKETCEAIYSEKQ